MKLNPQDQKNIQTLMKDPRWASVETAQKAFLMESFVQTSIKRESEFDTIWYLAFNEGGKDNIQRFFKQLEDEAQKV